MTTNSTNDTARLNQSQLLRERRVLMAAGVYLFCWVVVAVLNLREHISISWTLMSALGATALLINISFVQAIRRQYNLRFEDPSLTQTQMLVATLWGLPLLYHAVNVRAEGMMVFFCIFAFGMFRLNRRQLLQQAGLIALLYVAMLVFESYARQQPIAVQEWMRLSFLVMTLIVIAFLGGEIYDMRQKLHSRHLALARANQLISRQATHDALTGLHNRHFLMDAMLREEARHKRHGGHLSVVICDLDHFKLLNDRYGHLVGDEVLREAAQCLQETLRRTDLVSMADDHVLARFGGEEFVMLLPETPLEGARICAERLRKALNELQLKTLPAGTRITASFGVAEIRPGEHTSEMLQRADDALYEAKAAGRNDVRVALV